ncbi:AraC family transcriptional regulator [Aquabacterium soli]|uniref:AraC family transcriptional regulator n=1 Tax=Aquabacterium soli TaxID=2493092 RepID=A0A3R8RZM5_9BURK|nr:AraC family transcriptional regulator [Aquabacterium soli]RRS00948.1 AraC family transcriptional regulator [Aquabacterium soli]
MDTDRLVHWLLGSLELDTTIFHVGQYCGRWRASTAGRSLASFHLVLHGECWLHLDEGTEPVRLGPRDGVFLLRDLPHFISPSPDRGAVLTPAPMQPLSAGEPGTTGLACGFFEFHGALGGLLINSFPRHVVMRADDLSLQAAAPLFDLILAEAVHGACPSPDAPSPLIARLADVLFFYVIRHVARQDDVAAGLWAVARRTEFAPLLSQLLDEPGQDWSIERMAGLAHMSRASFCKHFLEASGQPPAQFLVLLRMRIAAQRLQAGDSIDRAAEHVGYRSYAAFSRAFKKVMGTQPGAWRRQRQQREQGGAPALH